MVAGLLDRAGGATPALTRPSVTLTFGGGGAASRAGSGLASGLASAVGVGPGAGPALVDGLVSLRLVRGLSPAVDLAEILLVPLPGGPDLPAPGDAGTIGLGAGDAKSGFACVIDLVEQQARGMVRLTASNGGRLLAQARVNLGFVDQNPGAIIDALASEVGVDSAAGNTGETMKSYLADDRRSVWDHVARLAVSAGRLAGFDDSGSLTLFDDTATGETVATFAAGEALIDYRIATRETGRGAAIVDGEGAGDKGGNSWAWLRKETGPMSATVGGNQPKRRLAAPWVRAQPAAQALADARSRARGRAQAPGRFLVQAAPQVVPGALIEIVGTGASDGVWLVTGTDLRFDLASGMITEVHAAPLSAGGGAGGPGGGLGGLP